MIFAKSKFWPDSRQGEILGGLGAYINRVRATKTLEREKVVRALVTLREKIEAGEFDDRIASLAAGEQAVRYKELAVRTLRRSHIEGRIERELGGLERVAAREGSLRTLIRPLGTLFHIAAGNVDGLPALSVAEGLLTGNFNILKLPKADNGLTAELLAELSRIEPDIGDFVAVFDTPSSDVDAMRKMAALADGIVLWGGVQAERAVRALAPAGVKLIEWGHRLGFAYVSGFSFGNPAGEELRRGMEALAEHIAETKQLLCSSCQVVYLNTARFEDALAFGKAFLPVLEQAMTRHPAADMGIEAAETVRRLTGRMEEAVRRSEAGAGRRSAGEDAAPTDRVRLEGQRAAVTVCRDSLLELSPMYGSVLVKRLPKKTVLPVLRQAGGVLQTAGILIPDGCPEEREAVTELLIRAGVNRITTPRHMSESFSGEAHDGDYPLRRYVRVVNVEEA